jgi:hypothetical protein
VANATTRVAKGAKRVLDEFIEHSSETLSAARTYYTHAMVGLTTGGYLAKFDDTQALEFWGLVDGREGDQPLPIGTAGDGTIDLKVHRTPAFELAIASVAITDIGKKVYAIDDQTGTLDASTRTYANLVGTVKDLVYATSGGSPVSGIALVEARYGGKAVAGALGASKFLAATGTQTLTKHDLNKTIFVPNTAAYSINLPAVATTQAGDRLTFVKTTSDAFAATLDGDGGETIDGATTLATIDAQFDTAVLVSTGSAWIVLSRDIT